LTRLKPGGRSWAVLRAFTKEWNGAYLRVETSVKGLGRASLSAVIFLRRGKALQEQPMSVLTIIIAYNCDLLATHWSSFIGFEKA
jgi:hypothetical protein